MSVKEYRETIKKRRAEITARVSEAFLADFIEHGPAFVERMRNDAPMLYIKLLEQMLEKATDDTGFSTGSPTAGDSRGILEFRQRASALGEFPGQVNK